MMTARFDGTQKSIFFFISLASLFVILSSRTLRLIQLSRLPITETSPISASSEIPQLKEEQITIPEWIHDYVDFHRASLNGTILVHNSQFLLYRCEGSCAGIGGRLKTMIKSLYASICSDRVLLIHSPSPFPLEHYLEPNLVQWTATSKEPAVSHHAFRRGEQLTLPFNVTGIQLEELKGQGMMDMHDVWNSDICQSFFRRKGISANLEDEEALFSWGFHTLFRFSKIVVDRAVELKNHAGVSDPYVGLHLRTNKGENWKDPQRQFEGVQSYLQCFHLFRDIHGLKSGYIAADNQRIKKELQDKDENLRFPTDLQIFHIDKSFSEDLGSYMNAPDSLVEWYRKNRGGISNITIAKQGMLDLFAELLVLAGAECVIMSKSGLSYAMHYIPITSASRCGVFISRCTHESVDQRYHKYVQRLNKMFDQD